MDAIEAFAAGTARRAQSRPCIEAATAGEFAVPCRKARAAVARLIRSVLARARRHRPRHQLGGLPAHLLRDIGIDRAETTFVAAFGRFSGRRGGLER